MKEKLTKIKFNIGDVIVCVKYGLNNSEMIVGKEYKVSEDETVGMIKVEGNPDWWSPERFTKKVKPIK